MNGMLGFFRFVLMEMHRDLLDVQVNYVYSVPTQIGTWFGDLEPADGVAMDFFMGTIKTRWTVTSDTLNMDTYGVHVLLGNYAGYKNWLEEMM